LSAADDNIADDLAARDPVRRLGAIARIADGGCAPLSDGALAALVACLGAERKAVQRRAADALAVAREDPRVAPAVNAALNSPDARLRWGAAFALGAIGTLTIDALPALCEALESPDGDLRWAAHDLLVRLGHQHPVVRTALLGLAAGSDPVVRKMALYCLRDLGAAGDQLVSLLEGALASPDAPLRLAALSALVHMKPPASGAAAIASRCLAADPDHGVRRAAAIALGHLGNRAPEIFDQLRRAAEHASDHSLARAARAALTRLGEP
jgi:HEAT repeat protein